MAVTTNKIVLFLAGGVAAAALVAYGTGAFDPLFKRPSEQTASAPAPAVSGASTGEAAPAGETAPGGEAAALQAAPAETPAAAAEEAPEAPAGQKPAREVVPPSFDVVRLESDGSIVVAGKAVPNAQVDLLVGSSVIGSAAAGAGGDFAVVLDEPLKPGDYQIVLRATAPDNVVAMSVETAVVSVPSTPEGQVLALVEEAGKPSQMITMPEPQAPAAAVAPEEAAAPDTAATAPAQMPPAAETQAAAQPSEQSAAAQPAAPAEHVVRVEAVEIDGRKIFVAGATDPGRLVRGYANEILLGDARASPDGRFLIEIERELPVGDYIIRVDALEPNGDKVVARAAVPFEREPGETIAAVAAPPETPAAAPAAEATAPAGTAPSAEAATPDVASEQPAAAPVQETAAQPQVAGQQAGAGAQSAAADTAASGTQAPTNAAPEQQPSGQAPAPQQGQTETASAKPTPEAASPAAPTADQSANGQPAQSSEGEQAAQNAPATQPAGATPAPAGRAQTVAEALVALSAANTGESGTTAAAPVAESVTEAETQAAAAPDSDLPAPPVADGVTETLAPKLQPVGSAIIIRRGDTLWRISRRVYGQGVRYSTIYLANQAQIEDPDRIWPGQVFKVPEKSADGEVDADYSTLGNRLTTPPEGGDEAPAAQ